MMKTVSGLRLAQSQSITCRLWDLEDFLHPLSLPPSIVVTLVPLPVLAQQKGILAAPFDGGALPQIAAALFKKINSFILIGG